MVVHGKAPEGLGDLEGPVMEALWERGALSTPEVHEVVGKPRGLAYTTILTTLQRLHKKGLLERVDSGRGHRYAPAQSRESFIAGRAQQLAARLMQLGDPGVAAFLSEAGRLDPDVVAKLRERLGQP